VYSILGYRLRDKWLQRFFFSVYLTIAPVERRKLTTRMTLVNIGLLGVKYNFAMRAIVLGHTPGKPLHLKFATVAP
jgi:hypothetical protein